MDQTIPANHFDRSNPFFPIVVNYFIQLLGFKEVALRGKALTHLGPILGGQVKAR